MADTGRKGIFGERLRGGVIGDPPSKTGTASASAGDDSNPLRVWWKPRKPAPEPPAPTPVAPPRSSPVAPPPAAPQRAAPQRAAPQRATPAPSAPAPSAPAPSAPARSVGRPQRTTAPRPARRTPPTEGPTERVPAPEPRPAFLPPPPRNLDEAGLEVTLVEQLLLRMLLAEGAISGRQISRSICLSNSCIAPVLDGLRRRTLVQHRGSDAVGDFVWQLTDTGRNRALEMRRLSFYVGPAPVPLEQYLESVKAQTVTQIRPGPADLDRAFQDLVLSDAVIQQVGPAITSGKGLFIYGKPGNGKSSIAERVIRAFGGTIWIPQTLIIDGTIINFYDPATHKRVPDQEDVRHDRRWVRIRRPTVMAGGELTLEMLDIKLNEVTNVCEAPLQLRANCGSLIIDDFGRQVVDPNRLLNRWIVPLERRIDFLRMPNARKLRVPFDVVLIFSTNMDPKDLVDEAFLRRIPYKVFIPDPTEEEFRRVLRGQAEALRVAVPDPRVWDWFIDTWYREAGRPLRFCHPRDLLLQVLYICRFEGRTAMVDRATLTRGAEMYFAGM